MENFINPFDGDVSDEKIIRWLNQFQPEEREVVRKLVNSFNYYSASRVLKLVKKLNNDILNFLKIDISKIWFVPVGYVAKSGSAITYFYKTQNKLPHSQFISPNDLKRLPLKDNIAVVFLDDFMGSGHQAKQVWETVVRPVINEESNSQFIYGIIAAYKDGIEFLKQNSKFIPLVADVLPSNNELFSEQSVVFKDKKERQIAKEIVQKYGEELYPNHELGYMGCQGLIGFFYSTPNNSLPIFWSTENKWKPLLIHGDSFRDPSDLIGPPPGLTKQIAYATPEKPILENEYLESIDIDSEIAIKILNEFKKIAFLLVLAPIIKNMKISGTTFSYLLKVINSLKHLEHEQKNVCSSILLMPNENKIDALGQKFLKTASHLTLSSLKEIESMANIVPGLSGAIVAKNDGKVLGNYLFQKKTGKEDYFLPNRYKYAANASNKTKGLLFVFAGNGRVTVFYQGNRIISHRGAGWHHYAENLDRGIAELSNRHNIRQEVFKNILRLAFELSDSGFGSLITLGDHNSVIQYSDPPNIPHLEWAPLSVATDDDAILQLMSQDGANIVSQDGDIIQVMTFLRPPAGTEGEEEVGKGSKHSTAVKISGVTNAICFAISEDGQITVYSNGKVSFKMMG